MGFCRSGPEPGDLGIHGLGFRVQGFKGWGLRFNGGWGSSFVGKWDDVSTRAVPKLALCLEVPKTLFREP